MVCSMYVFSKPVVSALLVVVSLCSFANVCAARDDSKPETGTVTFNVTPAEAVVPDQETEAALCPLPVEGLRLSHDVRTDLHRFGLRRIGDFPNLTATMEKRGWPDARIRKLMGENWLRFLKEVWGA